MDDLESNLGERTNLAGKFPEKVFALKALMESIEGDDKPSQHTWSKVISFKLVPTMQIGTESHNANARHLCVWVVASHYGTTHREEHDEIQSLSQMSHDD